MAFVILRQMKTLTYSLHFKPYTRTMKRLKTLKLIDVIRSAEFENQVRICLSELRQIRTQLSAHYPQYKLKKMPFDMLEEKKMCNAKAVAVRKCTE